MEKWKSSNLETMSLQLESWLHFVLIFCSTWIIVCPIIFTRYVFWKKIFIEIIAYLNLLDSISWFICGSLQIWGGTLARTSLEMCSWSQLPKRRDFVITWSYWSSEVHFGEELRVGVLVHYVCVVNSIDKSSEIKELLLSEVCSLFFETQNFYIWTFQVSKP